MDISNGSFEFTLRRAIEVHGVGENVDTLTFYECGEGYDSYYLKLRKHVVSAQFKAPEFMDKLRGLVDRNEEGLVAGEELKKLHELDGDKYEDDSKGFAEFLKMILGTSDELEELVKVFGHMIGNTGGDPLCKAEGVRVKEAAWKRLHIEDKIDAAVRYCAFFGIGLDKPQKPDSEHAPGLQSEATVL